MPGMHCVVVYTGRTRRERPQIRPCTGYTTVYTVVYPVHDRVVYPVHGRLYGPCTGAAHIQVHDARAMYMVRP